MDANGKIMEVTVTEAQKEDLGEAIVVVGYGEAGAKGTPVPNALKAEIQRVLLGLDDFRPATKDGRAVKSVVPFTFRYQLEE